MTESLLKSASISAVSLSFFTAVTYAVNIAVCS